MPTRRKTLQHSAVVASLLAGAGLFPQYAQAYTAAAFDAKSVNDALKALGAGAPVASKDVVLTAPDIAENGAVVPMGVASSLPNVKQLVLLVEKNPNALAAVMQLNDAIEPNMTTSVILSELFTLWQMHPTLATSLSAARSELLRTREPGQPTPIVVLNPQSPAAGDVTLPDFFRDCIRVKSPVILITGPTYRRSSADLVGEEAILGVIGKPLLPFHLAAVLAKVAGGYPSVPASAVPNHLPLPAATPTVEPRALKILVVEDTRANQVLLMRLLRNLGHKATLAEDGHTALGLYETQRFDVILMDIQMPDLSGTEVTAIIRERETKSGEHTPIIAVTANALKGDRERFLAAGMDGYVSKPIDFAKLQKAIDDHTPPPSGTAMIAA